MTRDVLHDLGFFGHYLHRYYYNQSIADGFTLRLLREGIRTEYRLKLSAVLTALEQQVQKGSLKAKEITASPEYVTALAEYIEEDFLGFRILTKEATTGHLPVGGMVVCASTEQAAALNEALQRHGVLKSAAILSTIGQSRHRGAYRLPHRRHRHRVQNPPAYHGIQTMQESNPALRCLVQGYFFYALFAIA